MQKRMLLLGIKDIEQYKTYLFKKKDEVQELFNELLIGVTGFFRDPEAFEKIQNILREIIQKKKENESLRIWSVGCSTGEEAYSLSILLNELVQESNKKLKVQIFASDVDERAIVKARQGIFASKKLESLPEEYKEKYFRKIDAQNFEIDKKLKSTILFSRQDITADPPFVKIDLIVSRNILIYFNNLLQKEILGIFHYALLPDGYLFLGKSESVTGHANIYHVIDKKYKIFRKNGSIQNNVNAIPKFRTADSFTSDNSTLTKPAADKKQLIKEVLFNTIEDPLALVNERLEIEEVVGTLRLYMEIKSNVLQNTILEMVNPELKPELRSLIYKVKKSGVEAKSNLVHFELFGQKHFVRLIVKPVFNDKLHQQYFLVVFHKENPVDSQVLDFSKLEDGPLKHRLAELEQNLEIAQEQLQTYTDELESSHQEMQLLNEELQSTNEELKSSNEELETSNEELQSANEELQMANSELQLNNIALMEKEEHLRRSEVRWNSLFENSNENIIVLDQKGEITLINQISSKSLPVGVDVISMAGKKFADYLDNSDRKKFNHAIQNVIGQGTRDLLEIRGFLPNSIFQIKMVPIKREDEITGAILFINDVTEQRHYEDMLYFLNMASKELLESLDLEMALPRISKLIVPKLADWFTIDILRNNHDIELLLLEHKDPAKVKWAMEYRKQNPVDINAPTGSGAVIRTGTSSYYPVITDEMLVASARNEKELELVRSIGFSSAMTVPLKSKGNTIGCISFITTDESNRHYSTNDLLLAEEFAKLVGLSLENIKLFDAARHELEERKAAQIAMEKSESQLQLITDALPVNIAYFTPDYKYKFVNDEYCITTGKNKKEILGAEIKDILGDDVFLLLKKNLNKVVDKGKAVAFEQEIGNLNREPRIMNIQYIPDKDTEGKVRGIVALVQDITSAKVQQRSIIESEIKARTIIEALPHIAWTAKIDGEVDFFNKRWYEYTGRSPEDSLGWQWIEAYYKDDKKKIREAWNYCLANSCAYEIEGRIFNKGTGAYEYHIIKAQPVKDYQDNLISWVGTCTNIQDQKQLAEKKDEFISIASHELKTPLATIKGYLQLLMKDIREGDPELKLYAEKANNSAAVLNDLIADLLDISRIQAGKLEFNFSNHNIHDMIEESVNDFKLSNPGIEINFKGTSKALVYSDKMRIEQVMQNLLSNAVKYAPESDQIDIEVEEHNGSVQVCVKDYGIGIEKEHLERVFEKYFRANEGSAYLGGLGVGLYICAEIIKRHDGEIWVESEFGKGAKFCFLLTVVKN